MYLTQALHRAVQQDPRRALTICGERVRSVSESADRVARLAAGLRALGVERGDRVPAEIGFALRDAAPAVLIAAVARPAADRTVTSGHLRDLAASDEDHPDLFERALRTPDADRWPFDLARIRLTYGERLRRTRSPAAAREPLTAALEGFAQLGARPWIMRTENELRAAGLQRDRANPPIAETLTPQQRQIALLAASGLSNKQIGERLFLSSRTVGYHLYQIFPKLGVTSRAALRDALTDLPRLGMSNVPQPGDWSFDRGERPRPTPSVISGFDHSKALEKTMNTARNVVLVHGGFVDGSGWQRVYHLLRKDGYNVHVVQNPTLSLEGDATATRQVLQQLDGPAVLVGHSYGGAVISEAGTHPAVSALVYIAAFAPDKGESVNTLIANPPPGAPVPPILPPQDGFLFLDRDKFPASFAGDLPADEAQFMADSQVPWGVDALGGAVSEPAWRTKPSWYLVATDDRMIPPPAQRSMADRAGSTVAEASGSHSIYLSQPQAVADLIKQAAAGSR
ncbi:alpha/beta fold hydrolase [Micromonospora sp. IBHARD004]|uniref:alpha/beta fold hydrolase n=1 Tax=Micromonospora sp. IBHARD004 TaxID=3457764 RepID=UPI004059F4B9